MIGFNIKGIDEDVIKGLGMVGEVRGFCINPDGVNVEVCEAEENGLYIKKADEGYKIIYKGRTNLYRACAILCGMIEEGTFLEVSETAKFDRCGVMIDCSRNAVLKVDAVKQIFSRLAGMGINYAMLYTEDTYELDDYPYFGYLRGRYTKSEMKEIDDIANDLGIELVPCIQTLAHLPRPFRWSFMEPMRDINDILLIDEPKTYELIDAMFKSWRECTSARAIHIGMDEAHEVTKGRYTAIHGSDFDRLEVLARHLKKVCSIAKKYDFEPMMWSDMFFRLVSDGGYYDEDIELPEDLNEKIPEELSLVYWDYSGKREGFNSMIKKHKKTNRETIFAGGIHTWVGLGPHNKLSFDSMKQGLEACREHDIKKVFATIWGDDGAEVPFYAALPGVQLFAEYNYYDNADNLETRFKQCTGMDMKSFMALELDDLDEEKRVVPWISTSKEVLYNDPLFGLFDKNFENEDMSGIYEKKLERINSVTVPRGMELLFNYYKRLIEVLKIKPQLTKDMLSAYKAVIKNPGILSGYRNTLIILVGGLAVNLTLTAIGAYFFSRKNVKLQKPLWLFVLFTMYFSGGTIPFYFTVLDLGLKNSLLSLILPTAVGTFNMIILRNAFASIPSDLEDAVKLDGGGHFVMLFRVILPLSKSAMAVMVMYYAVGHWNSWFNAMLFLDERELFPLQLILREILIVGDTQSMMEGAATVEAVSLSQSLKYAVIIVSTVPILLVYPFMQKYFVKGVMIGSVKG